MASNSCYNCNKKINEHTEEQKSECLAKVSETASFLKSMLVSLISVNKWDSSAVGRLSKKSPTFEAFMTVVMTKV